MPKLHPHHVIGVLPRTKLLRLERYPDHWRVWLQANAEFTLGQYLRLADDGAIRKVIVRQDEGDDEIMVKGPD